MSYYVYIIQSLRNGRFYIGSTNNIERRIQQHNSGQTKSLRFVGPFKLVYKEEFETLSDARKREYYIKRQKSRKFIEQLISSQL